MRLSCYPIILLSLLLISCSTTPTPPQSAYQFGLGKFVDARPNDDIMLMNSTPFSIESFFQSWQQGSSRSIFATYPALLDVTLLEYQATQSGTSYAISMKTTLQGRTPQNQPLANLQASCVAVAPAGATEFAALAQQAVTQANAELLTPAARHRTMWQKVFHSCVQQLTTQFNQALAAGP